MHSIEKCAAVDGLRIVEDDEVWCEWFSPLKKSGDSSGAINAFNLLAMNKESILATSSAISDACFICSYLADVLRWQDVGRERLTVGVARAEQAAT